MKKQMCQSCGMPIEKAEDFGTEKDGFASTEYCKYCYQSGEWTDPEMTLDGAIRMGHEQIDKMQISGIKKKFMKFGCGMMMKKLKRWRTA
ncbi:MAG: zinc ribbon domain-containing protein [Streptococcaceae bacterium]|jgi:hypothetical protein|nr:zinc ribbon domain-containing protein [Streptococcaceae bacterium]